jgi:hypothetical protein
MPLDSVIELERVVVPVLIRQQLLRADAEFFVRQWLRIRRRAGLRLWPRRRGTLRCGRRDRSRQSERANQNQEWGAFGNPHDFPSWDSHRLPPVARL